MKFVDPDGRKYGLPREAQKRIQERAINNSISYNDYNHIQQCKSGPVEYPVEKLLQRIDGVDKFKYACIYFSLINSFLMDDMKPISYFHPNLSTFIDNSKNWNYVDLVKIVFGVDAIYHDIPSGLTNEQLKKTIGFNPAVLIFDQSGFWGNGDLDGVHGVAYLNGMFHEPLTGRQGCDFNKIKSPRASSEYTVENYLRGFYLEVKKNED